jgi:hypothetical protein
MSQSVSRNKGPAVSKRNTKIVQEAVSGKLKAFYDDMTRQAVPDRFVELLRQLDDSPSEEERS